MTVVAAPTPRASAGARGPAARTRRGAPAASMGRGTPKVAGPVAVLMVRVAASLLVVAATLVAAGTAAPAGAQAPADQCPGESVPSPTESGVRYLDDDHPAHVLDVYRPAGEGTGRAAVLVVHGGGWAGGDKCETAPTAKAYADAGFVAFNMNYDTSEGGRFPREVEEVQAAARWVQDNAGRYGVDPAKLALSGSSAGGNLVMLAAVRGLGEGRPAPKAVVSWSGPSDLATISPPDGPEPGEATVSTSGTTPPGCAGDPVCIGVAVPAYLTAYLGCPMLDCPWDYRDASPVFFVSSSTPPMFLGGAASDLIPFSQNREMAAALSAKGVAAELLLVPGMGHAESLRPQLMEPSIDFVDRYVVGGASPTVAPGSPPVTAPGSAALPTDPLPQPPAWVVNAVRPPWWQSRWVLGGAFAAVVVLVVAALGRRRRDVAAGAR